MKGKIFETVERRETKDAGIAFSGGVDSSLLAKVCAEHTNKVPLLTVGFSSQRDIDIAKEVAASLQLPLFSEVVNIDELAAGLKTVLSSIRFQEIALLENALCFYYVFELASIHGISAVLSANGIDELFCGYSVYKGLVDNEGEMMKRMHTLVMKARRDKEEIDKLAALFSVEYMCPFLSNDFVDFAMKIPLKYKMKGENDNVRKHIVREVALELGVPPSAALRPKKAFQYSSGVDKAVRRLVKQTGFTKRDARLAGFNSVLRAYLENLKAEKI